MSRKFSGRTEDAQSVFLGADFWEVGTIVSGRVVDEFTVRGDNGPQTCYTIDTDNGVEVNGEEVQKVAMGGLTGFRMALRAAGVQELALNDHITIKCTGVEPAKKKGNSDRLNFSVEVVRPDVEPSRPERASVPF